MLKIKNIMSVVYCKQNSKFAHYIKKMQMTPINRLKVVLAEQQKNNKWLAEAIGKNEATISRWCTNKAQPSLETLVEIAELLKVDAKDLIISTKREINR